QTIFTLGRVGAVCGLVRVDHREADVHVAESISGGDTNAVILIELIVLGAIGVEVAGNIREADRAVKGAQFGRVDQAGRVDRSIDVADFNSQALGADPQLGSVVTGFTGIIALIPLQAETRTELDAR